MKPGFNNDRSLIVTVTFIADARVVATVYATATALDKNYSIPLLEVASQGFSFFLLPQFSG